jgi:copper chaperone
METLKFKTNINCGGCIATITPILNAEKGIDKWNVDIANPSKILTVETNSLSAEDIMKEVKKGGFKIEQIN